MAGPGLRRGPGATTDRWADREGRRLGWDADHHCEGPAGDHPPGPLCDPIGTALAQFLDHCPLCTIGEKDGPGMQRPGDRLSIIANRLNQVHSERFLFGSGHLHTPLQK